MSNLLPLNFDGVQVRVVSIDGEPWFVGKDLCEILGYANASKAMSDHCKGVTKRYPLSTAGGTQEMRVLSEPDMLRLIVNSNLPAAQRFERWVFEDVLPTIRRTGNYLGATTSKLPGELAIAECFVRWLRPAPSAQVAMLEQIAKQNGLNAAFLPGYVVDAAGDSPASSMATASLTDLLKRHGISTKPAAYNVLLRDAGMLEERTRKSTGKGEKHFWCVTERGLEFGKNLTNPSSPRETQPHWYMERFAELHQIVSERLVATGGGQ